MVLEYCLCIKFKPVSIDVPRDVKMVKKLMKKDQIFYKLKKKYAKGQ